MSKKTKHTRPGPLPAILDRELSSRSGDAFGHQHYADALRDLVESANNTPPYSIGLLGTWGTGKSSIKQLYLEDLGSDTTGKVGARRSDRFYPITFNAWRYGGTDDLKRALLRHVFRELNGDEAQLRRDLYQQVNKTVQTRRTMREWAEEAFLQNFGSMVAFVLLLAAVMGVLYLASTLVGLEDQWGLSAVLVAGAGVSVFLAKYVVDLRLRSPTFFNPNTVISFPQTSAEEYENLLVEQIHNFGETERGKRCRRLVIFVDDLDRLSAAEMVNGLDAVRTFLELPLRTGRDDFGVVFVISCDEDRVSDALFKGRGRVGGSELPGTVFSRSDARRYLDRLFQFRLEIPPFPRLDMRAFALKRLHDAGTIVDELKARGVEPADVIERLIHVDVQSPRNAIQLLNAFIQSWWIARRREFEGIGSSSPGALLEGSVTDHPKALAALCVLRVDFPDFYEALQKRPELVSELSKVLFVSQDPATLSVAAADLIREFVVVDQGKITREVPREYRGLRRYLASLQGLRWPRTLQPLLLLSEDPITRKYGARSADLYEAVISGDTSGVLEALGHHRDNLPLGKDDIVLLNEIAQDLRAESAARRIGAARVLAEIVDRIPKAYRRQLLTPLARHMVELKDVRTNVGPKGAAGIVADLSEEDQAAIAASFIDDFFKGKVDWRLPDGEVPDLEQITGLAGEAVDLALSVRTSTVLPANADDALLDWLLTREIATERQGQTTLPFDRLEGWLEAYPGSLLYDLGPEYTRQAISQLVTAPNELADIAATVRRVSDSLLNLAEGGADSRAKLWAQLATMVAAKLQEVVDAACDLASQLKSSAPSAEAAAFLIALSSRLLQHADNDTEWPLDWEKRAGTYLELVNAWTDFIGEDVGKAAVPLMLHWAEFDDSAGYAIRASGIFETAAPDAWAQYQKGLFDEPLGFASSAVYRFEGSILGRLSVSTQNAAAAQLTQAVGSDSIAANVNAAYEAFFADVRGDGWLLESLQQHLAAVMDRLVGKIEDSSYVKAVLQTVKKTLPFAADSKAGNFLTRLFAASSTSAKAFSTAHGEMVGYWPDEAPPVGQYGPTKIALRALDAVIQSPNGVGAGLVFSSAVDLIARDIADPSASTKLSPAVAGLWPNDPNAIASETNAIASFLTAEDIVTILTMPEPTQAHIDCLIGLVAALAAGSAERNSQVVRSLLEEPPAEISGLGDGALVLWLDALGDGVAANLSGLLTSDLNDEQVTRLSQYAFDHAPQLGLPFILDVLPGLLTTSERPQTVESVTSNYAALLPLAPSRNEKSSLVAVLIECLPAMSGEQLARTAALVASLSGKGALEKRSDILVRLDSGQIEIVARQIPSSSALAQRVKEATAE